MDIYLQTILMSVFRQNNRGVKFITLKEIAYNVIKGISRLRILMSAFGQNNRTVQAITPQESV